MITQNEAQKVLDEYQSLLDETPDELWGIKLSDDSWTLGEITGHLIDSAVNNHQRFVRLRFGNLDAFPGYEAEPWVEAQRYDGLDRQTLVVLWGSLNKLLMHVAFSSPQAALKHYWENERGQESLAFLITDYFSHVELHARHYRQRLSEIRRA